MTTVNKTIEAALGGAPEIEQLKQKRKDLEGLKAAGSTGFAVRRVEGEIAKARKSGRTGFKGRKRFKTSDCRHRKGQIRLAEKSTALEQSRLSARRDSFATAQGNLQVDRLTEKLNIINLNLRGKISDEKKQELELSKN